MWLSIFPVCYLCVAADACTCGWNGPQSGLTIAPSSQPPSPQTWLKAEAMSVLFIRICYVLIFGKFLIFSVVPTPVSLQSLRITSTESMQLRTMKYQNSFVQFSSLLLIVGDPLLWSSFLAPFLVLARWWQTVNSTRTGFCGERGFEALSFGHADPPRTSSYTSLCRTHSIST